MYIFFQILRLRKIEDFRGVVILRVKSVEERRSATRALFNPTLKCSTHSHAHQPHKFISLFSHDNGYIKYAWDTIFLQLEFLPDNLFQKNTHPFLAPKFYTEVFCKALQQKSFFWTIIWFQTTNLVNLYKRYPKMISNLKNLLSKLEFRLKSHWVIFRYRTRKTNFW